MHQNSEFPESKHCSNCNTVACCLSSYFKGWYPHSLYGYQANIIIIYCILAFKNAAKDSYLFSLDNCELLKYFICKQNFYQFELSKYLAKLKIYRDSWQFACKYGALCSSQFFYLELYLILAFFLVLLWQPKDSSLHTWTSSLGTFFPTFVKMKISKDDSNIICRSSKNINFPKIWRVWLKN